MIIPLLALAIACCASAQEPLVMVKRIAVPVYPAEEHLQGIGGEVILRITTNDLGKIVGYKVVSGEKAFWDSLKKEIPFWRWDGAYSNHIWKVRYSLDRTSNGKFTIDLNGDITITMPPIVEIPTNDSGVGANKSGSGD